MELLVDVQRRVFSTVNPSKIVELFKLGEGNPPTLGMKTADVVDGFYSFLGFPRLINSAAIRTAIARGIKERFFGYYSGATPTLGSDGKYQVPLARVRFDTTVSEDEIDVDTGFLVMPQAISAPAALPTELGPVTSGGETPTGPTPPTGGTITPPPLTSGEAQKTVTLNFSANRDQLFAAWNAIANLADLAGKVTVTVHADSEAGFDRSKLQNGVLEPLRESDLIE
jgi:hypothetical protein